MIVNFLGSLYSKLALILLVPAAFGQGPPACQPQPFCSPVPSYLVSTYPKDLSTGVPTNTAVQVHALGNYGNTLSFVLRDDAGASVPLQPATSLIFVPDLYYSVRPVAELAPSSRYLMTISTNTGAPNYTFQFSTGAAPDKTKPVITSIDPAPGSTGVSATGPITVRFSKLMDLPGLANSGAFQGQSAARPTDDGYGVEFRYGSAGSSFARSLKLAIRPSLVQDAQGNPAAGENSEANYTTFAAQADPVTLRAQWPRDEQQGVPTNPSIRLLFQQYLEPNTAQSNLRLERAGVAVPFTIRWFADGRGIALQPADQLQPNQRYRVAAGAELMNSYHERSGREISFEFVTGDGPDLGEFVIVDSAPRPDGSWTSLPANGVISLRTNKPMTPMMAEMFDSLSGVADIPLKGVLSADGQTLTLTPAAPLIPGTSYRLELDDLVDMAGRSYFNNRLYIFPGDADESSPSITTISPPAGSQEVPPNTVVQLLFSRSMSVFTDGMPLKVTEETGTAVPGTASWDSAHRLLTFKPAQELAGNRNYSIELGALRDTSGHDAPEFHASFATAAENPGQAITFLQSEPASGATGVDPSASITLTFSGPVNPAVGRETTTITGSGGTTYPLQLQFAGNTVICTPMHALPPATRMDLSFRGTTLAGESISGYASFTTGAIDDTTAPFVESTDPAVGGTLAQPLRKLTLRFSEPMEGAALTSQNLLLHQAGTRLAATVTRGADDRSVSVQATSYLGGPVTLVATSALTDMAGNHLATFTGEFHLDGAIQGTLVPAIREVRPRSGVYDVSPDTHISWFLTQPVLLADVERNLVVVADGAPVAGRFQLAAGGTVISFIPDAPFAAGAEVHYFQRAQLFTSEYNRADGFTVQGPRKTALLTLVRMRTDGPPGSVLDFEFNVEPELGQNLLYLTKSGSSAVVSTESRPRPRTIRLTPVVPLVAGQSYIIHVAASLRTPNLGEWLWLTPQEATAAGVAAVVAAAPEDGAEQVALNASIRLRFGEPLNALALSPAAVHVEADGRTLPVRVELTDTGLGLLIIPLEPWPESAVVSYSVEGLEDRRGRQVEARTGWFHSGHDLDWTAPELVGRSMPASSGGAQADADATFQFVFNEPIDPASVKLTYSPEDSQLSFSQDLKTITVTPSRRLREGMSYRLSLWKVFDLSGNESNSNLSSDFVTAFGHQTGTPSVTAVGPADQETGLPLNTQIVVSFDRPVATVWLEGIRLTRDGNLVPLRVGSDWMANRLRLVPVNLLLPGTGYDLEIGGVRDGWGHVMEGIRRIHFTTGQDYDNVTPSAQLLVGATLQRSRPIRILFSKPMNRGTFTSETLVLNPCTNDYLCYQEESAVAASIDISDDARQVTVTPQTPLETGRFYNFTLSGDSDNAGNLRGGGNNPLKVTFLAVEAEDTTPPRVTISPADGLTGLPVNVKLTAAISERVIVDDSRPAMRVFRGDEVVSGSISGSGQFYNFTPNTLLQPNSTYRIEVPAMTDLAGNTSEVVTATFTTGSSQYADYASLNLLSTSPAAGEAGVPLDAPLVFTFNKIIDPATVSTYSIRLQSPTIPITGTFSVTGATVTFTPTPRLPAAAQIWIEFYRTSTYGLSIADLAGNRISYSSPFSFRTAALTDTEPPKLLSISPEPGTALAPKSTDFRLTFSEPVVAVSLGIKLYAGSQQVTSGPYLAYGVDPRVLSFSYTPPSDSKLTLIGTADLKDEAGNSIDPFVAEYPTLKAAPDVNPQVVSSTPASGALDVDPMTPVQIQFNKAMDPVSTAAALHVTQDGVSLEGRTEMQDSGSSLLFTPSAPYAPGSRIDVFVLTTAQDLGGRRLYPGYTAFFTVSGSATANALRVVGARLTGTQMEVNFDRDLDPRTVDDSTVWLRQGPRLVPSRVTLVASRRLRLDPDEPLAERQSYTLTLGAALRAADGTAQPGAELVFTPFPEASRAPADAAVVEAFGRRGLRLRFSAPHDGPAVRAQLGGRTGRLYFTPDQREWLFLPDEASELEILRKEFSAQ